MLVVVVVLGVLAAVVTFAIAGMSARARVEACAADRTSIQTGVDTYFGLFNRHPAVVADRVHDNLLKDLPRDYDTRFDYDSATGAVTVAAGGSCDIT